MHSPHSGDRCMLACLQRMPYLRRQPYDFALSGLTFMNGKHRLLKGNFSVSSEKVIFLLWVTCCAMVYNNRGNWMLQNPGGRRGLSVWELGRSDFILCHAVMKSQLVKAFSWLSFVLIMFGNVSNASCTFERKKRNHFKEELPPLKQILSDLGLETWAPCEVCESSPSHGDIEHSAWKWRRILLF